MRKSIITSAILLGTLGTQAGSFSFVAKPHIMQLSDGNQMEVLLQQEISNEDVYNYPATLQSKLSHSVLSHEKMLQILNKVTKEEQEVNEEVSI